jgi:hypothetical protein
MTAGSAAVTLGAQISAIVATDATILYRSVTMAVESWSASSPVEFPERLDVCASPCHGLAMRSHRSSAIPR